MPSLGYLIDHPAAIAARNDPRNWPLELLVPVAVPVPVAFDTDCGPTLDQDGTPACVAFSATEVRSYQERTDEGKWAFSTTSATRAYSWLKNGHDAWPGDGAPDGLGSYPLAVWRMAKQVGIPGIDGVGRPISAYYQLQGTPGDPAWIDLMLQVILQFGPVTVSSAWPNNWWTVPATGHVPAPAGVVGAHQWARKGYKLNGPVGPTHLGLSPTGRYWANLQSWGTYGHTDEYGRSGTFYTPFEGDHDWSQMQIAEVWKTIDVDEYPNPTPEPTNMTLPIYNPGPWDQAVDLAIGTPIWAPDGKTPLTKVANSLTGVRSPFAVSATMRLVRITTGGVLQGGLVATTACKNMRPFVPTDVTHKVRVFVDGVSKWEGDV
jgi:hypothetical protein